MNNLSLEWLLQKLWKHRGLFLGGLAAGLLLGGVLFAVTPKKFKAVAKINVSPRYFQSPMMRDFLPETYDPSELRAEREAAITSAITPEFLKTIAAQDASVADTVQGDRELETLRRQFEILRESATTFQIAALAGTSEKAYELCQALTHQIMTTAREKRIAFLEGLRDSVASRIRSMSGNESTTVSSADLTREISTLEAQRQRLSAGFRDSHPEIRQIDTRLKALKALAQDAATNGFTTRSQGDATAGTPTEIRERLLQDLLSKLQMLEIVVNLEKQESAAYLTVVDAPLRPGSPVSPRLPIYLAWGMILGLLLGTGLVIFRSREELINAEKPTNTSTDIFTRRPAINAEITEDETSSPGQKKTSTSQDEART